MSMRTAALGYGLEVEKLWRWAMERDSRRSGLTLWNGGSRGRTFLWTAGDYWGLGDCGITSSSSSSASRLGSSHSAQWPPSPRARLNKWHSWQRLSPTERSPHELHSYTVWATSARRRRSSARS